MKSDMMKWLLLVLLFPLCDFVFYFLSDALGEEPATWFSADTVSAVKSARMVVQSRWPS